jgi:hypothetical protein
VLIWLIALCSIRFYTFLIPVTAAKAVALAGIALLLGMLAVYTVYGNRSEIRKRFTAQIVMIFMALIISAFAGLFFHNQPVMDSLFAEVEFLFFLTYILLHLIKPDPDRLVDMFVWIGYMYCIIYFVQYLVYPIHIVSARTMVDRGTVRSSMPGLEYMFASWFILLSRYFITNRIKYLIGLFPVLIIIILLASRQLIAATVFLTFLNILLSKKVKSKFAVFFLITLSIIPFFFLFQGIFNEIFSLTKRHQGVADNIRLLTAHYFLFDFNHNPLWILTGNGSPSGHSEYGMFLTRISDKWGYYMSDVGVIGDFSKFGILFTLAQLIYLIKLSIYKYREKYSFVRYVALSMLITMFSGAGLLGPTIVHICFLFYIVDADKQTV